METLISNPSGTKALVTNPDFVMNRYSSNLLDGTQVFLKRVLDILISSIFLILIGSWLFPIIAILIRLDSKGPVVYKQLRGGQYNDPFFCFKFRTMTYNPEDSFKQASKNDSRVTKIGAFLRKTSIDELPQVINVLIGDMSIVGPRPHAIQMNKYYSGKYESYMMRHLVKPGITGLAQAKGYRGEIRIIYEMTGRLKYDLFYIKKWSIGFDIKILFMTIYALIFNNCNAY